MILAENFLRTFGFDLLEPFDAEMVNPASIDFRIGADMKYYDDSIEQMVPWDLKQESFMVHPGEFILVSTYETIMLPTNLKLSNGAGIQLAADMLLKSSRAREGWNHSLAFWFDPGWNGKGTMELSNIGYKPLELRYKMRMGQLRFHVLFGEVMHPYNGRYNNATVAEESKPGN